MHVERNGADTDVSMSIDLNRETFRTLSEAGTGPASMVRAHRWLPVGAYRTYVGTVPKLPGSASPNMICISLQACQSEAETGKLHSVKCHSQPGVTS